MTDFGRPPPHGAIHEDGGRDEISIEALSGTPEEGGASAWDDLTGKPSEFDPEDHATDHESGGDDELDITGLPPADHASTHESGGDDEIDCTGLGSGMTYTHAGDPSGYDFQVGNLTTNGQYQDLDLASIVTVAAVAVHLEVNIQDDEVQSSIAFRKKGLSNNYNRTLIRNQLANVTAGRCLIVALDANRKIEYSATNTEFTTINIAVLGWFI